MNWSNNLRELNLTVYQNCKIITKQNGKNIKLHFLGEQEIGYLSCPCSLKSISNSAGKLEPSSSWLLILKIGGQITPPYMGIEFISCKIFGQSSHSFFRWHTIDILMWISFEAKLYGLYIMRCKFAASSKFGTYPHIQSNLPYPGSLVRRVPGS